MTLEAAAAPVQAQPQQPTQPSAFHHPKLGELLKRASASGGIGAVLIQLLHDLVVPQDTVLYCFYVFDAGATGPGGAPEANAFYSIQVVLVTSAYFINIELMPKTHAYRKRKIYTIADVQVKYDPPSPDELRSVQPGKYCPANINLTVVFADERGAIVDTWNIESTHPEQVRNLMEISRVSSRAVGFPLAKLAGTSAASSSA